MKIQHETVKVYKDEANKVITQFTAEDGSVWQRDDKKIYKELSPNRKTLQDEFDTKLGVVEVEKPNRESHANNPVS